MADQPNILFVDDEDSIRLTLPPLLQSYGFEVISAATVAEALGLITRHKFDVLISDLNIGHPGDGFTVVSGSDFLKASRPRGGEQYRQRVSHRGWGAQNCLGVGQDEQANPTPMSQH